MPSALTGVTTPLAWQQYLKLIGIGPLWFLALLLIFDFGYAAWRTATQNRAPRPQGRAGLPGGGRLHPGAEVAASGPEIAEGSAARKGQSVEETMRKQHSLAILALVALVVALGACSAAAQNATPVATPISTATSGATSAAGPTGPLSAETAVAEVQTLVHELGPASEARLQTAAAGLSQAQATVSQAQTSVPLDQTVVAAEETRVIQLETAAAALGTPTP